MATETSFDLIVVGAGPGGYMAAAHAAASGMRVACIEKAARLGGVCLNVGCIPSKALLDSSEYYHLACHELAQHGVITGTVELDLARMMARKEAVVDDLTKNVKRLLERNKVALFQGSARLTANDQVTVTASEGDVQTLQGQKILLATGSEPVSVPGLEFDGSSILSSTEALSLDRVPDHLVVVGGGYIGLELGSVWRRLGSKVTVVEMLPGIATGLDGQLRRTLERTLKRQKMAFKLRSKVTSAKVNQDQVELEIDAKGKPETLTCDKLLVAVGRRPLTRGLGLSALGIVPDPGTGSLPVNAQYQTQIPSVYAIGDLVAGPMLAHKASAEGIAAVDIMLGKPADINYDAIPSIVYTWPEVACVGLTEEQVKEKAIPYKSASYPFTGTGRARCLGETGGLAKIIAHKQSDRILGVHIMGARAADMIAEAVLALQMDVRARDLARTVHGHPTFSEALQEAAMALGE